MTPPPTLTARECDALLTELRTYPYPYNCHAQQRRNPLMALLMLDAGLRVGEVVKLNYALVYWNSLPKNPLFIPAEISKSKESGEIPLSLRLAEALKTWQPYCAPWQREEPDRYLFPGTQPHTHITTRQVERIFRAAAARSLGRDVHPHVLRHTFGTLVTRASNTALAQKLLRHRNLSSTQIYLHPNADDAAAAVRKIEETHHHGSLSQS
jgi:integrase